MKNFDLPFIPERVSKPRELGITMVMDKGLSFKDAQSLVEMSKDHIDIIKLGFGTSYFTPRLEDKIKFYQQNDIKVYLGGTLFEAFVIRGMYKEYVELITRLNIDTAEVSDGSIEISHEQKCEYIRDLKSKGFTVLSEVGSKSAEKLIPPYRWIEMMEKELQAGSWKVIAEAREGGNVGIYRGGGEVRSDLIEEITRKINVNDILWETPQKSQQIWFLKLLGPNVNLGNIATNEVIPLECLRVGLRGDTFFDYLPEHLKN
ncbi:MAG: phosphosulfolactate synthase [Flavobacteriales bacterium]|jgi:phosphosulfolactate synthase|nr:phosphosulfolactate synthase [Flavobacteriales bacterium]